VWPLQGVRGRAVDTARDDTREQARHEGTIPHVYHVLFLLLVAAVPEGQTMLEELQDGIAERGVQIRPSKEDRGQARQMAKIR